MLLIFLALAAMVNSVSVGHLSPLGELDDMTREEKFHALQQHCSDELGRCYEEEHCNAALQQMIDLEAYEWDSSSVSKLQGFTDAKFMLKHCLDSQKHALLQKSNSISLGDGRFHDSSAPEKLKKLTSICPEHQAACMDNTKCKAALYNMLESDPSRWASEASHFPGYTMVKNMFANCAAMIRGPTNQTQSLLSEGCMADGTTCWAWDCHTCCNTWHTWNSWTGGYWWACGTQPCKPAGECANGYINTGDCCGSHKWAWGCVGPRCT